MTDPHVIIGGGAAGAYAARAIAERGIRVVLLTDEAVPPYDRTVLTKAALTGEQVELPPLWPDALWRDLIDLRADTAFAGLATASGWSRASGSASKRDVRDRFSISQLLRIVGE